MKELTEHEQPEKIGEVAGRLEQIVMLRYSKKTPVEEGFYWLNDGDFEGVVEVFNRPGHNYLCILDKDATFKRNFNAVNHMPYLWAGPIQHPAT